MSSLDRVINLETDDDSELLGKHLNTAMAALETRPTGFMKVTVGQSSSRTTTPAMATEKATSTGITASLRRLRQFRISSDLEGFRPVARPCAAVTWLATLQAFVYNHGGTQAFLFNEQSHNLRFA